MIKCPNKNTPNYIKLAKIKGNDMAHFLWEKYDGNIPDNEYTYKEKDLEILKQTPQEYKREILQSNGLNGFIKPIKYTEVIKKINWFNLLKGEVSLSLAPTNGSDYVIIVKIPSIVENDIEVEKTNTNSVETTLNTQSISNFGNILGFNTPFREKYSKVNFILGKILNNNTNTSANRFLAHWLKKLPNEFKDIDINLVPNLIKNYSEQGRIILRKSGNIIEIDNSLSEETITRTILHELLHNITINIIDKPLTEAQKKVLKSITDVRETAKKYYEQLYNETLTIDNLKKLYDTNRNLYNKLRPLYGLVDNHEFISELFTNGEFQRLLSIDKFDKEKSFFDRILEVLKDLFNTINILNRTENDNKFLQYALGESIKLIDNITNTPVETIESLNNTFGSLVEEKNSKLSERELISKYLEKLIKRKDKIEEDLRKEKKNYERKKELQQLTKDIDSQISNIKKNYDYISVLETAQANLEYVNKLFTKDKLTDADIVEMQNFVALYKNVTQFLPDTLKDSEDTSIYDSFGEIEKIAKKYDEKLFNIISSYGQKIYKEFFNKDVSKEELFKIDKDISTQETWLLSAGRSGVKLLEMIEILGKLVSNKATETRKKLLLKEEELHKSLKQNTLFQQEGSDIFLQKDENNKWTGNRVTKFNQSYWREYHEFIFDKYNKDNKLVRKGINKLLHDKDIEGLNNFFDWYKDNQFLIDYNKIKDEKYKKQIVDVYGEFEAENIIKQAEEKLDAYNKDYEVETYRLGGLYNGKTAIKYLKNWELNNSPYHFNDLINSKTKELPNFYNTTYVTSFPLKKHYSEQYQLFEKPENKALLDYMEFIEDLMNKQFSVIPDKELYNKRLNRNTLPILGKSIEERYAGDYSLSALTNKGNEWINQFITHNQSSQIEDIDEYTQRPAFNFKLGGLNPITKVNPETGKSERDIEAQTKDISFIIKYAIDNYSIYKHKSEYEDMHRLLTRAVNNIGITDIEINANPNELKNVKTLAEFNEKVWYGKSNEIEGQLKDKFYTKEEKEIKKQLEENIEESDNILKVIIEKEEKGEDLTNDEKLVKEEYTLKSQNLKEGLEKLGVHKSLGKTGRSLLKYVQLKTMAWNIPSFLNELIFGAFSSWNFAVGREIFNEKDWSFAFSKMLNQYRGIDKEKINRLLDKFRVHENNVLENSDTTNKISRGLYSLQSIAEKSSRTLTMISLLNSIKVQTNDGEKTLYDILDKKGEIDTTNLILEEKEKWTTKSENDITELDRVQLSMSDLFNKIHGNYDIDTQILAKDHFLGLAALQFRGWIPEALANRFQKEQYNSKLGIHTKGRYLTMNNLESWKGLLNYMSKGIIFGEDFDKLKDIDKSNIRKNAIELYALLTVTLAVTMMLKYNDDDEDDNMTLTYLSNVVLRLQSDLLFFINPNEIEKLNSKLIPTTQLLNDINDVKDALWDTINGEPILKTGIYAGHNKFLKETAQSLPITNQIYKLIFLGKKTLDKIK